MTYRVVDFKSVIVPKSRQRVELDPAHVVELADSITDLGLLHLPVVRHIPMTDTDAEELILVAGECRMKAIDWLWQMGRKLRYGSEEFEIGRLPVNFLGELDPISAFAAELEENIRRRDLSWQDRSRATTQLLELRTLEAARDDRPAPTTATIAAEARPDESPAAAHDATRKELIVARHLHDPDISKAKSVNEAFKILKRKEDLSKSAQLARDLGATFTSACHLLLQGDFLDKAKSLDPSSFDCILTDPPYGIGAQDFNDSGGKAAGGHFYDDSPEMFRENAHLWMIEMYRLAKPQAHLYWFCDIEWFTDLRNIAEGLGFKPFRTPLVWINPSSQRAPWPLSGPQRKYQLVLYATKGDRPTLRLAPDVVTFPSDDNLNHPAQKPVALYRDFLSRTCRPGDRVLDPFCGSGTIFPAAHEMKIFSTGVELNPSAYGISAERLKSLK